MPRIWRKTINTLKSQKLCNKRSYIHVLHVYNIENDLVRMNNSFRQKIRPLNNSVIDPCI